MKICHKSETQLTLVAVGCVMMAYVGAARADTCRIEDNNPVVVAVDLRPGAAEVDFREGGGPVIAVESRMDRAVDVEVWVRLICPAVSRDETVGVMAGQVPAKGSERVPLALTAAELAKQGNNQPCQLIPIVQLRGKGVDHLRVSGEGVYAAAAAPGQGVRVQTAAARREEVRRLAREMNLPGADTITSFYVPVAGAYKADVRPTE